MGKPETNFLNKLETLIQARVMDPKSGSYTSQLVAGGLHRIAQKLGEEGVELALASVSNDRDATIKEAADLVFHLLVLLNAQGIALADVIACLQQRHHERP